MKASGWDKGSFGRNSKVLAGWTRIQFNLSRADQDDNGAAFEDMGVIFDPETGVYSEDADFDQEAFRAAAAGKKIKADPLVASSTIAKLFTGRISARALRDILKETFPGIAERQRYNYVKRALDDKFLREVGRDQFGKIYAAGKSARSDID